MNWLGVVKKQPGARSRAASLENSCFLPACELFCFLSPAFWALSPMRDLPYPACKTWSPIAEVLVSHGLDRGPGEEAGLWEDPEKTAAAHLHAFHTSTEKARARRAFSVFTL
jgi:hypothetical protein